MEDAIPWSQSGLVSVSIQSPMLNPYEHVDWKNALRITSTTHMHMTSQEHLDTAYRYGVRHFAVSNYYPSMPTRPDSRRSDYRLHHDWPIQRHGKPMELPVNRNDVSDSVIPECPTKGTA